MLLGHLLHEGLVGGFGKPAFFVQQGQEARRVGLVEGGRVRTPN